MNKTLPSVLGSFSGRQLALLSLLVVVFCLSLLGIGWQWSAQYLVEIPKTGGSLTEGVVGSPRFINPVLAISDTDRDLTSLIYSGLFRLGTKGELEPDLAKNLTISEDHLNYTITLKENLHWHDGKPLTAHDVAFTITQIKNPVIKSPRLPNWDGVEVSAPDEKTIIFTLKQPYAAFLENLTLGILPKHLWSEVAAENFPFSPLNIEPIGSGPYVVKKIKEDGDKIKEYYELAAFTRFALGTPKIKRLTIRFYPSEDKLIESYESGETESLSTANPNFIAGLESNNSTLLRSSLPRVFGIFFNHNQNSLFTKKEVRQALSRAIDRKYLVDNVLAGFGKPLFSPIPGEAFAPKSISTSTPTLPAQTDLTFTLATADIPELKAVAEIVKADWEKLGAQVEIKVFETGDLNEKVIRPREYEALLFGEIVGREPDPFAFWHSSQRLDPGLNIALYTNATADKILEEARGTIDRTERLALYTKFVDLVTAEQPAIFLYTPDFLYLLPKKVVGASLPTLNVPSERFANIHNWYIETEKVWPMFATENNN